MTQQDKNQLVYQHRQRIENALHPNPLFFFHRRRLMKTLHSETLPTLVAHGYDGNAYPIPEKFIRECMRLNSFAYFNDLAAYLNDMDNKSLPNNYDHPTGKWALLTHLKGLSAERHDQGTRTLYFHHYSQASPEERSVQRAIINAATTIDGQYLERHTDAHSITSTRLASVDLIHYIADNPDRSEEIVALINERQAETTEANLKSLDELITTMRQISSPLIEGAL